MIQLTFTLKMTTAQVVEMSVTTNNNSPVQHYVHLDDHTQPTFEMTLGFKPFTVLWHYPENANVNNKQKHRKEQIKRLILESFNYQF